MAADYSQGIAPFLPYFGRPAEELAALQQAVRAAGWRRVVDLGAGLGASALGLAEIGCEVRAVEPDTEMAAVLTARLAERAALMPRLAWLPDSRPLPAAWADAVLSQSVLHLLDAAAQDALLAEAARLLQPEGALWLELPLWSRARAPRPWSLGREAQLGGLQLALHQQVLPVAEDGTLWRTDWRLELNDGPQRLLTRTRDWTWQAWPVARWCERLAAAGWGWQGAFGDWAGQQAFDPDRHTYGFLRLQRPPGA